MRFVGRTVSPEPDTTSHPTPVAARTISDFGDQWSRYPDNSGYYGSLEMFADHLGPLAKLEDFRDARVADIGSGTGRIVNWLLQAGAREVIAVEPAAGAYQTLQQNLQTLPGGERVLPMNVSGADWKTDVPVDWVVSIGVIHHIPEPAPVLAAAYRALRPGGRCLVWLYGVEGNRGYLSLVQPLRALTTRLPHALLRVVVEMAYWGLVAYRQLARVFPLPLRRYLQDVLWPMSPDKRRLVIYDQLNPAYARYYSRAEAERLLTDAGFHKVEFYHRHHYSWTVVGSRPANADAEAQ